MKNLFLLMVLSLFFSCAGPTSPFGSNILITNDYEVKNYRNLASIEDLTIESYPKQKIYSTPYQLRFTIKSQKEISHNFRYDIIYNNQKLQRWWTSENIRISPDKRNITIEFDRISLIPGIHNEITFLFYEDENSDPIIYNINEPQCNINYNRNIASLGNFDANDNFQIFINEVSKKYNINSHLLAALVAQESSFNPKAVSWAKAMGLTQITPIANEDILAIKTNWIDYPGIRSMSLPRLKYKIWSGDINASNDWRLDHYKSLEGGSLFLSELTNYWSQEKNSKLLNDTFSKIPETDIILASYNSGAYRVRKNIQKYKNDWLWADDLKEARKYVMNIKSYCYQFKTKR